MNTRTLVGTLTAWGGLSHASIATADTLDATLGEPIAEISHAVRADVDDGIAKFRVRRTIANRGERHEEAVLTIRLPAHAAATGLRIRVGEKWYDGELMERERAAELYRELTGVGPHLPRDPALLSWLWADRLELRVFPVPPHGTATVEYTLTVPTEYRAGVTSLSYPVRDAAERDLADPALTVAAQPGAGTLHVDGRLAVHEQPIVLRPHTSDPRCEQLGLAENCVVSVVEAPALLGVKTKVEALVRHTYASDLHVVLATPDGATAHLWSNEGGDGNDVRIEHMVDAWNMPAGPWLLGVADEVDLDVGVLADWSIESATHGWFGAEDLPLHLPDAGHASGVATIELPTPLDAVATRFAHVERSGAHVSRLEIDLPAHLSELPTAPHVIFVIDASFSAGVQALDEQRRLIEGFLGHTPDARVEVVATRRKPSALFGEFIDAENFAARWEELATTGDLALGNGSNLDLAVAFAEERIQSVKGRRYVIAFSDDRLRPSWGARGCGDRGHFTVAAVIW